MLQYNTLDHFGVKPSRVPSLGQNILRLLTPSYRVTPDRSPRLNANELCGSLLEVDAQLAPIFQLSRAEKLQLAEELWDSIAQEESLQPLQPLAQWKIDELIRRKEAFEKDPSKALTWEQVKASIIGQGVVRRNLTF